MKAFLGYQDAWDVVENVYEDNCTDCCVEKNLSEGLIGFVPIVNSCGQVWLCESSKNLIFKRSMRNPANCIKGDTRVKQLWLQTLRGKFKNLRMEKRE